MRKFSVRRRHSGQSLVLFLVFAAASVATLLIVFNVGQLTSEKEKLVNTADAAAYSAAITEARTLNFEAYMNRGIVANEVIIAQIVSFDSWINYLDSLAQNLDDVAFWIPVAGEILSGIAEVMGEAKTIVDEASQPAVAVENGLAAALNAVVQVANGATYPAAYAAATQVIAQNVTTFNGRTDPAAYLTNGGKAAVLFNLAAWSNFATVPKTPAVAAQVISDSRDGFSITRQPAPFPLQFTLPLVAHAYKNGGTQLSSNYSRWDAQDKYVFGLWGITKSCPFGCWQDATLAEGDSSASRTGGTSGDPYSRSWMAVTNDMQGFTGIPALLDIKDRKALTENTPNHPLALDFLIEVAKNDGDIKTSSNTADNMGVGAEAMPEKVNNNRLSAASQARVYFSRPDSAADVTGSALFRSDASRNGYIEYGSVYSPYWQVKLIPVTNAQKAELAIADGAGVSAIGIARAGFTP
jgi:hypothetical protein